MPDAAAIPVRLVLLKREATGEWAREGQTLTFDDDDSQVGEERAEAQGQSWVQQDQKNRDYSVLRRKLRRR